MITMQNLIVPDLDHDAMMLKQYNHKVSPEGKLERRLVAALIAYMGEHGWQPCAVYDGDYEQPATDTKSAMELIFNLDMAHLYFTQNGTDRHWVYLVLGNGCDIVSDWNYFEGDRDGFDAAMEKFDPEVFA